jgi:hypothetical protein
MADRVDVARGAGHDLPGRHALVVADVERLDVVVQPLAQVAFDADRDLAGLLPANTVADGLDQAHDEHPADESCQQAVVRVGDESTVDPLRIAEDGVVDRRAHEQRHRG